jgi:hypothetical protein
LETIVGDRAGSYGAAVADWAERVLEVQLMPWQRHVLDAQLSYDAAGVWCNRMSLVSVARQNGKTVALKALVGWYLTEYAVTVGRPVTVLTTAHKLDLAVALFQELAPIMEARYDAEVKWSYGRNQLVIGDHKWIVRAATPSAGHGQSCDLIVADELWDISSEALDVGLLPTQRAKPNPLCSMWSTAGTEASTAMLRWREQGIKAIDDQRSGALYFAEYSPPPQLDPMSEDAWAYANPALGYTIQPRTLQLEAEAPNRAGFLRSSVNLWVQTDLAWLRPGLWHDLKTDDLTPAGGVIACETSLDDGRYVAIRAVPNGQHVQVTVEFTAETQAAFWQQLEQSCQRNPASKIALSPTLDAQCPPALNHRKVVVGFSEIVRYTQLVRNMILEGRVRHTGEQQLAEHVGRAVAVRTQGSLAISSQRSPGPIEMARCMVWAVALVSRPGWNVSRPAIATSLRRPA